MRASLALALLACLPGGIAAAAAGDRGLVCIAPSAESDAGKPLPDVDSLEFYFDMGNPRDSYSVPFVRVQSNAGADGRVHNSYRIGSAPSIGATIDFAGDPPAAVGFSVVEINKTMASTGPNEEETGFMADAVPGVACYAVTVAPLRGGTRS